MTQKRTCADSRMILLSLGPEMMDKQTMMLRKEAELCFLFNRCQDNAAAGVKDAFSKFVAFLFTAIKMTRFFI